MTDSRDIYYTNSYEITRYFRPGQFQTADTLSADSGSGATNKDEVYMTAADVALYTPGDYVLIYDTANPKGEVKQVYDTVVGTASSYIVVDSTMTGSYEATVGGACQLLSAFIRTGNASGGSGLISTLELNRLINDVEAEIDQRTGHAWTTRTISNEVHEFPITGGDWIDWKDGLPVKLLHRKIATFSTSSDHLYVNENTGYTDKLGTWTEALNGQFWVDYDQGIIYIRRFWQWHKKGALKITYRYGESTVPKDIREAATLMVVVQLLEMEHNMSVMPGGGELNYDPVQNKIDKYQAKINRLLKDREEIRFLVK